MGAHISKITHEFALLGIFGICKENATVAISDGFCGQPRFPIAFFRHTPWGSWNCFFDFLFFLQCTSGISEEPVSETSCAAPQRTLHYSAGLFGKRALANRPEMYQKRLIQFEIYLQRSSAQHPNAPCITVQEEKSSMKET